MLGSTELLVLVTHLSSSSPPPLMPHTMKLERPVVRKPVLYVTYSGFIKGLLMYRVLHRGVHRGYFGIIWGHFGVIWDHLGHYGIIGIIRDNLGLLGVIM